MHSSILLNKFLALNITIDNIDIWKKLLSVDMSIYKPVIESILNGDIDIEDLGNYLYGDYYNIYYNDGEEPFLKDFKTVEDFFNSNIYNKIVNNNTEFIKEGFMSIINNEQYRQIIIDKYEAKNGKLTEEQKNMLFIPEVTLAILNVNFERIKPEMINYNIFSNEPKDILKKQIQLRNSLLFGE